MKKSGLLKTLLVAAVAAVSLFSFAACGPKPTDVTEIVVAITGNAPFFTKDADTGLPNGGYDYEILQAIDEKLPQYAFKYEVVDALTTLLAGLDTDAYDIGSCNLSWTKQREEAGYLFSETYIPSSPNVLFVKVGGRLDSPNITTLDQAAALPNVKIAAYAGSSAYDAVVNYNASHTNKFIVESAAFLQQFNGIGDGSIDALIGEQSSLTSYNNFSNTERYAGTAWNSATQKGYDFKILAPNEPIFTETFHYLLGKTKTELKTAVDGAIKELKAAGTLDEIYTANQNKPR